MRIFNRRIQAIVYVCLLALTACSHLFYHPSSGLYLSPDDLQFKVEEITFPTGDGSLLYGWYFPPASNKPSLGTVVQFHGNAQNRSAQFASLHWVTNEGYGLFSFDYRGYGENRSKPSQKGLNEDALAAIERASKLNSAPLILFGQSLGGAVLTRAVGEIPKDSPLRARILAVIIDSSFTSYRAIGRNVLSRSWISWILQPFATLLVSDEYSPEEYFRQIAPIPTLVIHGDADRVVPVEFGKEIFALCQEPKTFWLIPNGNHIDVFKDAHPGNRKRFVSYLSELPRSALDPQRKPEAQHPRPMTK